MTKNVEPVVDAVVVAPAPVDELSRLADTRRIARFGLIALAIGFGSFILWAALVPLDQGVPTVGSVSVDTKRKVVQHLQGGIVKEVLAREGQWVEQNQPLLRLNDSAVRAGYESARQQFYSLKALEGRLFAEQTGLAAIAFDPALVAASKTDPKILQQMNVQSQLMQARRRSVEATLGTMRESALGYESIIASSTQIAANLKVQLDTLEKEIVGVRDLAKEGYLPLSRQFEMERMLASIRSQIAENTASQTRARQSILEIRQRELTVRADYQKEVEQQLSQMRPELQAVTERFKAATEELGRTEIQSPAAGQVVGLTVQTVGSVIQPGQRIMEIVPKDEALVIEARVEPHLIDRVQRGDPVDLRFSSFADSPQLVVTGKLTSLSADTLTDQAPNARPYYLARVEVTPEGLKELGARKMQPGMPVEVVVKTGRRTLLQYILHPLTKRMAASLKEE